MKTALDEIRTAISICNDLRQWEIPMKIGTRLDITRKRLLEVLSSAEVKAVVQDTSDKVSDVLKK